MDGRFCIYYRIRPRNYQKEEFSLPHQRRAVAEFLGTGNWTILGEFTELEIGSAKRRPELKKALDAARRNEARLLIAKLNTLSAELSFLRELEKSEVAFLAADAPEAHRDALKNMIKDAEETARVLRRPMHRPPNASRRGIRLRTYRDPHNGELARRVVADRAREQAMQLKPLLDELHSRGLTSLSEIARELTARQIPTSSGAPTWSASLVARVIKRINARTSSEPDPPSRGSL